jgi:hypothetical protein
VPELKKFEEELLDIINQVEVRPMMNTLQQKMKEDMQKIKNTEEMIVKDIKSLPDQT